MCSLSQLHFKKLTEMSENRLQSDNSSFSNCSYFCISLCVAIVTVAIQEREKGFIQWCYLQHWCGINDFFFNRLFFPAKWLNLLIPVFSSCPYLHRTTGDTERKYHLRYYKTGTCIHETDARGHCVKNGLHCAFAHGPHDLRPPVYDIRWWSKTNNGLSFLG